MPGHPRTLLDQLKHVDARDKPGHDEILRCLACSLANLPPAAGSPTAIFPAETRNQRVARRFSQHQRGKVDAGSLVKLQKGVGMYLWLALFLIVADVSVAFAQGHQGTQQEQQACSRDASRFCRKDLGNDGAVQQCLQQNRTRLSASCDRVFRSHGM
jgi:hypothetical protein